MQVLTDNYLNVGLGAESALENERQLLVEEQKSCRVRARKFSVETNRRRKNLEERRKQWVIQERQLQDNILQQRRQRVQDATERFQRAHLPPSQRRRQSFRKATTNIEEALHRIQGSFNSHECRSPFLSTTISRSCTPSPKPPTAPRTSHSRSAVEAYANMLQERSMACFKGSQQMFDNEDQVTQERDRDTLSPQETYTHRLNHSDSLSSLDSLENVDPSHRTFNVECFNSRTQSPQRSHNDTSSDTNASPLKNPISDDFIHWHSLHLASKAIIQEACEELNNCVPNLPDATYRLVPAEKPQLPLGHCNLLSLCDVIDGDTRIYEESTDQNSTRDKPTANINVLSGNAELEFSCLKAEKKLLDLTLHSVLDNSREKHESATEIILSAKKDTFPEGALELNNLLNHNKKVNTLGNTTNQHATKEDNCPPSKMQCSDSVNNNLNKVSNAESKEEMSKNTGPLYQPCLSNIKSNSLRCFQHPEEHLRSAAITYSDSKICEVQFVKGILKKRSKYVGVDAVSTYGPEHLMFARQVLAIRDSIELMRTKTKDADNNSIKKKLRWFDQVSLDAKDKEQSAERKHTQMRNKRDSEDHRLATLSGASVTSQALAGDHLTKQAWADAGVHTGRLQEQGHEVKTPRNATKTVRPKVPRRECSARAGAGPVSWRSRKGTLVRPQSAAEVSQIARALGKMMAPRPPPRTDSAEEKQRDPTSHSGGRASSRGDHAGVNCDHTEPDGVFSPHTRQALRAHSGVAYAPLSHACQCPEGRAVPGQQESQKESRQRCGGGARSFCLACTPTDEEISMLWCGVRSALASKDARAILSHVTLTGGKLISCVKSIIRTGGFFLSPCNARGMARRQACDGSGARRKMCVEQSSHFPASGSRRLLLPAQPTKQATVPRLHTTYDPALPEGLESHCQMAQTHGQDMLGERDIIVATETVQTQRPGGAHHCSQQPGLTAISLEERRLLLSLDRLNHQLQCVQEHAAGGFVQVPSEERTRDGSGTANQKYRILSADGSTRHQRRF